MRVRGRLATLAWGARLEIRAVMRVLRDIGCDVNVDTGFHVHHEWPWWTHARSASANSTSVSNGSAPFIPPAGTAGVEASPVGVAVGNRYCQITEAMPSLAHMTSDRYVDVNFTSLSRYSTIEFRQHQGTLNYPKALAGLVSPATSSPQRRSPM